MSHIKIIAMGKFKNDLLRHISDKDYENIPEGTPICWEFGSLRTSNASRGFADYLNVDLRDPATYYLNRERMKALDPNKFVRDMEDTEIRCAMDDEPRDVADSLIAFAKADFHLFVAFC